MALKQLFKTKPNFVEIDPYKIRYNIGCMLDIPTGAYVKGSKGENLLTGGLSALTAFTGKANSGKSTIMHYLMFKAGSNLIQAELAPYFNVYDTEMNVNAERLQKLAERISEYKDIDLVDSGSLSITDITLMKGDEWFETLKDFLRTYKLKNAKEMTLETPFIMKDGKTVTTLAPSFGEIDSLTKYETSENVKMQDKNKIGDSGANMLNMRGGLDKNRLINELIGLCSNASHYTMLTAHIGKNAPIQSGPMQILETEIQHMKREEKVKGISPNLLYLTTAFYQITNSTSMIHKDTKGPEFPVSPDQLDVGSNDLNLVKLKNIRNKFGPSGFSVMYIVSQSEGVKEHLSYYYTLKMNAVSPKYGISGNDTTFHLDLLPDLNLRRTTIRGLIDNNANLRRALKITMDLLQIKIFYKELPFEIPPVDKFYEVLQEKIGWSLIYKTRDNWTFDQYTNKVPYLSTYDMLEIYHGLMDKPYWWDDKERIFEVLDNE